MDDPDGLYGAENTAYVALRSKPLVPAQPVVPPIVQYRGMPSTASGSTDRAVTVLELPSSSNALDKKADQRATRQATERGEAEDEEEVDERRSRLAAEERTRMVVNPFEELRTDNCPIYLPPPLGKQRPEIADGDGASLLAKLRDAGAPVLGVQSDNRKDARWDLFCDRELVDRLFALKSYLNSAEKRDFVRSRDSANPYELLGDCGFISRAALKLAELDAMFGLGIDLEPGEGAPSPSQRVVYPPAKRLLFADICAGPGGFTQYMFWRRRSQMAGFGSFREGEGARGFGLTLRKDLSPAGAAQPDDDWKLPNTEPFRSGFDYQYGADGSGNILRNENMWHFAQHVHSCTGCSASASNEPAGYVQAVEGLARRAAGSGVDLVTADGGVAVEQHNYQEAEMKQLVLCQFTCALSILREGGTFVCKIFDMFLPFTVSLLWLFRQIFNSVCIAKPFSSRPANSERYIICIGLKVAQPIVLEYLYSVNIQLSLFRAAEPVQENRDELPDIISLAPVEWLISDRIFCLSVRHSNNTILKQQQNALRQLGAFIDDPRARENASRFAVARKLLRLWNIPERSQFDQPGIGLIVSEMSMAAPAPVPMTHASGRSAGTRRAAQSLVDMTREQIRRHRIVRNQPKASHYLMRDFSSKPRAGHKEEPHADAVKQEGSAELESTPKQEPVKREAAVKSDPVKHVAQPEQEAEMKSQ